MVDRELIERLRHANTPTSYLTKRPHDKYRLVRSDDLDAVIAALASLNATPGAHGNQKGGDFSDVQSADRMVGLDEPTDEMLEAGAKLVFQPGRSWRDCAADVWRAMKALAPPAQGHGAGAGWRELLGEAWGALNFILAFYEPGQRHLDTNAWKNAEASGRRVHAKLRAFLDAAPAQPEAMPGREPTHWAYEQAMWHGTSYKFVGWRWFTTSQYPTGPNIRNVTPLYAGPPEPPANA